MVNKASVEKRLVEKMLDAYDEGKITEDQIKEISAYARASLLSLQTEVQVVEFLKEISAKWAIFEGIDIIESKDLHEKVENEIYSGVLALAKHGKIEDAIKLAKSATLN